MTKRQIIKQTEDFIKKEFSGDRSGHDWWHIWRVWQLAKRIGKAEHADMFVVEMAALLHDLGDYKLEPDRVDRLEEKAGAWLNRMRVAPGDRERILHIVARMSFSKNVIQAQKISLEGKVVQDADRLDAIGAMGVVRCFTYAGAHGIPPYIPGAKPRKISSVEQFRQHEAAAIHHFHEKLLLIKDRLNTKTAKQLARNRHAYMEKFLEEFFSEWEGVK